MYIAETLSYLFPATFVVPFQFRGGSNLMLSLFYINFRLPLLLRTRTTEGVLRSYFRLGWT